MAPLKLEVDEVNTHAAVCRATEALGFKIIHELRTYCVPHELRSVALLYAASYLKNQGNVTTRISMGNAIHMVKRPQSTRTAQVGGDFNFPYYLNFHHTMCNCEHCGFKTK